MYFYGNMGKVKPSNLASKQKRVEEITAMLNKGMDRKAILQQFAKTYKISARTVDNEIKEAKSIIAGRKEEAEQIRLAATKAMTEEAIKEGLRSDLELEVILCQIAGGGVQVAEWVKGEAVLRGPTPTEIVNAAKALWLKRGSNAPVKSSVSITNLGKDLAEEYA